MVLAVLCLSTGLAALKHPASAAPASESDTVCPRAVPVRALSDSGRRIGGGWALPLHGGYVVPRSLVANAARVELEISSGSSVTVTSVGAEDVEANLVLLSADAAAQPFAGAAADPSAPGSAPPADTSPAGLAPPAGGASPGETAHTVLCGDAKYPILAWRPRDIPVFGIAFTGQVRFREPIAGCPVLDANGALEAVTVWENRFGSPSAAFVPAGRLQKLAAGAREPWDAWRVSRQDPERQLRDNLLSEAMVDMWREHYGLAQENLSFLLERNPEDARGWYYRGYARAMSGRRKLALADYENAVYFDPGNAEARFSLGVSYAMSHRLPEAMAQAAAIEASNAPLAERLRALAEAIGDSGHEDEHAAESPKEPAPAAPIPPH